MNYSLKSWTPRELQGAGDKVLVLRPQEGGDASHEGAAHISRPSHGRHPHGGDVVMWSHVLGFHCGGVAVVPLRRRGGGDQGHGWLPSWAPHLLHVMANH